MEQTDPNHVIKTACGGVLIEPEKYPSAMYRGQRFYFCTRACLGVFEQNPEAFMAGEIEHPLGNDEAGGIAK